MKITQLIFNIKAHQSMLINVLGKSKTVKFIPKRYRKEFVLLKQVYTSYFLLQPSIDLKYVKYEGKKSILVNISTFA